MNETNIKILKDDLDKYKRSYAEIVRVNEKYQQKVEELERSLKFVTDSLVAAQKAVDINKSLTRQMAEEQSRKERELIEFMNKLKAKLREMGYNGSFDKLGN